MHTIFQDVFDYISAREQMFRVFFVEKGKSTFKKISNPNLSYLIKPSLGIAGSVKWKDNSIVAVILNKHLR